MKLVVDNVVIDGNWDAVNRTFRFNGGAPPVCVVVNAHVSITNNAGIPVTGGIITAVNIVNNRVEVVIA